MTYTEQAIKIAIENGYTMFGRATEPLFKWWIDTSYKDFRILIGYDHATRNHRDEVVNSHDYIWIQAVLLDPLFWQALGRGLGWDDNIQTYVPRGNKTNYMIQWHRFIDHLIEGKDIESYFKNLLEK